jgi:hypothetical protein
VSGVCIIVPAALSRLLPWRVSAAGLEAAAGEVLGLPPGSHEVVVSASGEGLFGALAVTFRCVVAVERDRVTTLRLALPCAIHP